MGTLLHAYVPSMSLLSLSIMCIICRCVLITRDKERSEQVVSVLESLATVEQEILAVVYFWQFT